MSMPDIDRLWRESQLASQANVRREARKQKRGHRLEHFWTLGFKLLSVFGIEWAVTLNIRLQLKEILKEYLPKIRQQVVNVEYYFNEWEAGNRGPSLCGSDDALGSEERAREEGRRLSAEMLEKVSAIPFYKYFYRLPRNPARLVANPYPGYLSAAPATSYCDFLQSAYTE